MKPVFHGQSGAWQPTVSPRLRPGIMRGVGKPLVQIAGPALVAARSDVERVFENIVYFVKNVVIRVMNILENIKSNVMLIIYVVVVGLNIIAILVWNGSCFCKRH